MSARIMNALARLAQGKMLGPLFTTCETQQQVSTQKLERYLETVGDQLKDCAFEIRTDYDALAAENARLRAELAAVREQQAIARRADDRIVQLCTTPHESKERFIRRVQSVIEWERAAQQDQPQ